MKKQFVLTLEVKENFNINDVIDDLSVNDDEHGRNNLSYELVDIVETPNTNDNCSDEELAHSDQYAQMKALYEQYKGKMLMSDYGYEVEVVGYDYDQLIGLIPDGNIIDGWSCRNKSYTDIVENISPNKHYTYTPNELR